MMEVDVEDSSDSEDDDVILEGGKCDIIVLHEKIGANPYRR